jgi:hypothetical protein
MGHLHPYAASSAIGCRAPISVIRGTEYFHERRQARQRDNDKRADYRETDQSAAALLTRPATALTLRGAARQTAAAETMLSPIDSENAAA